MTALANQQRLMILCHLSDEPLAVGELNARVPLSQSALSQRFPLPRRSQMVRSAREAQSIRYSLPPRIVMRSMEMLHAKFCDR